MEQRWSENRYQPASETIRRPSSATTSSSAATPTSMTVSASTASTVPTLASASLPTSVQKFMPGHLREPILDHPGYAHALITPEYDATIMYRTPEDQARDQVHQTASRRNNANFHKRMAWFMVLLVAGPFIFGVFLQFQGMNTDVAVSLVILGWALAIALVPVWVVQGLNRGRASRVRPPSGLEPGAYPTAYGSRY